MYKLKIALYTILLVGCSTGNIQTQDVVVLKEPPPLSYIYIGEVQY